MYIFDKKSSSVFNDTYAVINETINGFNVYRLSNWYQIRNNSCVPLSIVYPYDDFGITTQHAVKIGGNNTRNGQTTNSATLISKQFFKYDPLKKYEISVSVKGNHATSFSFGFVGLTSRPNILVTLNANEYINDMLNLDRFALGNDGVVGIDTTHYAPINSMMVNDSAFHTHKAYFMGHTATPNAYTSTSGTINDPIKLRSECEYFMPYITVHLSSVSKADGMYTILDEFDVNVVNSISSYVI